MLKDSKNAIGLLSIAFGILFYTSLDINAQRHPESQGPLPYYRDEPGYVSGPEWLQRPPFIRGPRDRYERGSNRMFLGTGMRPVSKLRRRSIYIVAEGTDSLVPAERASLEISEYTLGSFGKLYGLHR